MTLPRLDAMAEYWRVNPPMHQLLAMHVGYKVPEKPITLEEDGGFEKLVSAMGGMSGG